jgi:hypothetical protein
VRIESCAGFRLDLLTGTQERCRYCSAMDLRTDGEIVAGRAA